MYREKFALLLFVCLYSQCIATNVEFSNSIVDVNNNTSNMPPSSDTNNQQAEVDYNDRNEVIKRCNESYSIPINFLDEMNMTGSYPDETEKSPLCFMKCMLEMVGVSTSENVIQIRQATSYFSTSEDIINNCVKEQMELETDPCEYSYFLARCIMMAALVDNRNSSA